MTASRRSSIRQKLLASKKLWEQAAKKMDPAVELMEMSLDETIRLHPARRDGFLVARAAFTSPMQRHM
jgi:hypothetical protein